MTSRRRVFLWVMTASLLLLLLSQWLSNGPFAGASVAFAAAKPKPVPAHTTYQSFLNLAHQSAAKRQPFHWFQAAQPPLTKQEQAAPAHPLPSAEPPTMRPITQTLSAAFLAGAPGTPPLDLVSSDHRLEIQIPAGAFDLSHASASGASQGHHRPPRSSSATATPTATPSAATGATATPSATLTPPATATASPRGPPPAITGPLTLRISEQHGQFVGQSNQLGQYLWQIVDAQQRLVSGITLRHPLTIIYHYQPAILDGLDLNPAQLFLSWPDLAYADRKAHRSTAQDIILFTNHAATDTLTATSTVLDNGPFSLSGDPQNQSQPSPDLVSVSGNSGQSSYSYPIQVAPAPDGFTPQLALDYSSGTTNERQSMNSPAGDEGDGWTLSLGAITATVFPGGQTWYSISGVDGISDRLVPDPSHSHWFLTEHLSYLRINNLLSENGEPCFQVWDKSDTYYQFGCTKDSLQYYHDSNGLHLYAWDLNLINAPNEGQSATQKDIQITYFQDCGSQTGSCPDAHDAANTDAIRDAGIERVEYGSGPWGGPLSIDGTVDFFYWAPVAPGSVSQWAIPYSQEYQGNAYDCGGTSPDRGGHLGPLSTNGMRCDDPQNYSGGLPAPTVMSTLSLLSVTSYVGPDNVSDGTGGYPAYEYQFAYQDTHFSNVNPANNQLCIDPLTQLEEYCAYEHLLARITPSIYQSGTAHALPPMLFHYYPFVNSYSDHSQTVPGGSFYFLYVGHDWLDYYYDSNTGTGAHIFYNRAYSNTNGTPYDSSDGDDRYDPFFCPNHAGGALDCETYGKGQFAYPDNQAWTQQAVTQITTFSLDSSSMSQATTTYAYVLHALQNKVCPADQQNDTACVSDTWWPQGDTDWEDFYHSQFQGFDNVEIVSPANDLTVDTYYSTDGGDSSSDYPNNVFAGDLIQQDVYQGPSRTGTHLSETHNSYAGAYNSGTPVACDSAIGDPYDPCEAIVYQSTSTMYEGSNASNPPTETTNYYYDDYNPQPSQPPSSWALNLSGYHNLLEETTTGTNTNENSASATISKVMTYTTTDSGYTQPSWYTYDVNKVAHSEIDDSASPLHKWDCTAYTYDEGSGSSTPQAGWTTTVNTYPNAGCNPPPGTYGTPITTSYTGYDAYGNPVATVDGVGAANQSFYGSGGKPHYNGCTLTTAPSILSSAWTAGAYTTCTDYDGTYNALPLTTYNAFGQSTQTGYAAQQGNIPTASTDANGQVTSYTYSYDQSDNRTVQVSEPGDTPPSYTTQSATHTSCPTSIPTGSLTPCYEVDTNTSTYPTAITETFYDGLGRKVETRSPGPTSGDDTIQFTVYNDANRTTFTSVPFQVTAGSGWIDPASESSEGGTITYYDALNRVIAVDDPIFNAKDSTGISCPSIGTNATSCTVYELDSPQGSSTLYDTTKAIDPNNHVAETMVDAMGRTAFTRTDSGVNNGTLTPNQQISYQYDALGDTTQVTTTDEQPQSGETTTSVTVTMQYDDLGRLTQLVDPDRGTHNYSYDADGHLIQDTAGSRTLGYNYDLLGRLGCEQTAAATANATGACSAGTPLIQNTYDQSAPGVTWQQTDYPIGRLTQSVSTSIYPDSTQTSSTESVQYDQRGRVQTQQLALNLPSTWGVTTALPVYQLSQGYNDANQPASTQTSTIANGQSTPGYTFTQDYDSTTGTLVGLSGDLGTTPDVAALGYNTNALVSNLTDYASDGSSPVASEQFAYDGDLRPQTDTATWGSGSGQSGTIWSEGRWYDNASNVVSLAVTQAAVPGKTGSGGSETENFCYNEQNELVWASNAVAPSPGSAQTCGSQTPGNSLNGGSSTTSYVYTNLGQLWQGPVAGGSTNDQYLYCNTAPHQLSGIYAAGSTCASKSGQQYKASSYDAWGNVTGRTSNGNSETVAYDELDRMVKVSLGGGNNDYFAYDASGNRTVQRATSSSATTLTVYAFGLEEYQYSGTGTLQNATHYYSLGGRLIGELTGLTTLTTTFFLTDALGSVVAAFSNTKGAAALNDNQVYGPYGNLLYNANGTMGTAKGYTGQYSDPLTGLDYYVSRYYDPVAGIFLSADTKEGKAQGMNPYAYVAQNPETLTDPSGQMIVCPPGGCGGPPPPPPPPNHGPVPCTWQGCENGNSGNNSSPTPTHHQAEGACGDLTLQECSTAQSEQQNSLHHLHTELTWLQLLAVALTLASDIAQFIADLAGGLKNILSIIGDVVSMLGDAASLFSSAVTDFGLTSLQKAADTAAFISNGISSLWKTVRVFLDSGWGRFISTAAEFLAEGVQALFTGGTSELLSVAVNTVIETAQWQLEKTFRISTFLGLAGSIGQTLVAGVQWQIDQCSDMPLEQVYQKGGC